MKRMKTLFITAASLILIGCVIFAGVMTVLKWDFRKLSTVKYETNSYEFDEEFQNISVSTDTADVVFQPSTSEKAMVVCYEPVSNKHQVIVEDGVLDVKLVDSRNWYQHIALDFSTPKITVYLPREEYGNLVVKVCTGDVEIPSNFKFNVMDISASTGDVRNFASCMSKCKIAVTTGRINVQNATADEILLSASTGDIDVKSVRCTDAMSVKVTTGKVVLDNVSCNIFQSFGNTGDIILKSVVAKETFSVARTTGDIKLDSCDAAVLMLRTDTGDVTGSLCSEKVFIAKSDTGRIDVPKTTSGGTCEIETNTGDIKITIQ